LLRDHLKGLWVNWKVKRSTEWFVSACCL